MRTLNTHGRSLSIQTSRQVVVGRGYEGEGFALELRGDLGGQRGKKVLQVGQLILYLSVFQLLLVYCADSFVNQA